jgi:hypothetical protein
MYSGEGEGEEPYFVGIDLFFHLFMRWKSVKTGCLLSILGPAYRMTLCIRSRIEGL